MATYFFDSSGLVKSYVSETGSSWVRSVTNPAAANDVYVVRVTEVEITSAIVRRRRSGTLTTAEANAALIKFRQDLRKQFQVIEIDAALLVAAVRAVEVHGLRAYDAVQLAGALTLTTISASPHPPITIVSSDQELNAAARSEGILVEDPNNYP